MIDLALLPTLYSDSQKEELVLQLQQHEWERCVTLTTKKPVTSPEMYDYLIDFTRRLGQKNQKPFKYWFGMSDDKRRFLPEYQLDEITVHVHGVISGVENLTNDEIDSCWRARPLKVYDVERGLTLTYSSHLGFLKVTHFDGSPKWFYYCLNQTHKGEVYTNIEELKQ